MEGIPLRVLFLSLFLSPQTYGLDVFCILKKKEKPSREGMS